MRREERAPGRGLRSIQLWRKLSAARSALEQERDGGEPPVLEDVLREAGIDERLFEVARAQLAPAESAPAAAETARGAGGCVVRSTSGRISLKVVPE
jgi:hypothetical protein